MKYRVAETTEGIFLPQFKPGFFSFWKFFSKQAEINIDSGCPIANKFHKGCMSNVQ